MTITALTTMMGYNNTDGNGHTMPDLSWSFCMRSGCYQRLCRVIYCSVFSFQKLNLGRMWRRILREGVSSGLPLVKDSCLGAKRVAVTFRRLICNWPRRRVSRGGGSLRGRLCALRAWVPRHPLRLLPRPAAKD